MAVSLYDMMRPMALIAGVAAANGIASDQGDGLLQRLIIVVVALAAGIPALGMSQIVAKHFATWVASRPSGRKVAPLLMALYLAVFVGIALATFGAGLCAQWITDRI
jgi:hypothetical protein